MRGIKNVIGQKKLEVTCASHRSLPITAKVYQIEKLIRFGTDTEKKQARYEREIN